MGKLRALGIVTAIVLGVFVIGAVLVAILSQDERSERSLEGDISRVEVLSERGALTIRAGAPTGATVAERRRWVLAGPEVTAEITDGTLRIDVTCPAVSVISCSADLDVSVPPSSVLDVKTVRGRLEVRGVNGTMDVISEDGDVFVQGGPSRLESISVTGDVTAELSERPDLVRMRSETGDMRLVVPGGDYAITANSALDEERVEGLTSVTGAARVLEVSSGRGRVVVSATP